MTDKATINPTLQRFEFPKLLVRDYEHWVVLLRRHQVTLGAFVLAAKADVTAWPALPPSAFTELSKVTAEIEATLQSSFQFDKINYLMLMMNDPNPHFHAIPRYSRSLTFEGADFHDPGWPKTPDLAAGMTLEDDPALHLLNHLKAAWVKTP